MSLSTLKINEELRKRIQESESALQELKDTLSTDVHNFSALSSDVKNDLLMEASDIVNKALSLPAPVEAPQAIDSSEITIPREEYKKLLDFWYLNNPAPASKVMPYSEIINDVQFALTIPNSCDYEEDPAGQVDKICEILEKVLKALNAAAHGEKAPPELIKALEYQVQWRMRDGSPCACPAGKEEDEPRGAMPTRHSTSCAELRKALSPNGSEAR